MDGLFPTPSFGTGVYGCRVCHQVPLHAAIFQGAIQVASSFPFGALHAGAEAGRIGHQVRQRCGHGIPQQRQRRAPALRLFAHVDGGRVDQDVALLPKLPHVPQQAEDARPVLRQGDG